MIKFFRRIRHNLLTEGKTGRYFKYALGEIVLVVIGILIALNINNWNEERKDQNKLLKIYNLVYNDIRNDKKELINNVDYFDQRKFVFEKVAYDSIVPGLLDEGLSRLLVLNPITILNTTGVNQLRELQGKDSLTLRIIETYDMMNTVILPLERYISDELTDHAKYLRDNYDWYPEWINNTITQSVGSKELHDYFLTSPTYRNRVVSVYQQAFNNYTPQVKKVIDNLSELENELSIILEKKK